MKVDRFFFIPEEVHILPESSSIMVQNNSIIGVDTQITLNTRSRVGGLVRVEKKKKRIELKIFSGNIHFPGETDKISRHSGILIPPGTGKTNSKESKKLKNWIYVQRITPTKKKYFVLVRPVTPYEISDGINLATLFPQDPFREKDNMQLRVVIYYVDLLNKTLDKAQKEKMEEYFEQWNERIDNERTELKLTEATKAYVTKVIQYVQEEKKDKDIRPVREVKTYLEENYHQEISLNDLADIVSLNASYLSALFKKETGMTYTEYVMFCRLEKAKELLADTGKSIAEIADAVGYHDTRHFSKLFTRNIGLKPSEYRKLYS